MYIYFVLCCWLVCCCKCFITLLSFTGQNMCCDELLWVTIFFVLLLCVDSCVAACLIMLLLFITLSLCRVNLFWMDVLRHCVLWDAVTYCCVCSSVLIAFLCVLCRAGRPRFIVLPRQWKTIKCIPTHTSDPKHSPERRNWSDIFRHKLNKIDISL